MTRFIPLILFTVLSNFASQVMLKHGMVLVRDALDGQPLWLKVFTTLFNPWVFIGLATMVVSMASHLIVLSRVEISFAYPFLGLSFVLITAWGYFALGESVGALRLFGVLLITAGVIVVARSA